VLTFTLTLTLTFILTLTLTLALTLVLALALALTLTLALTLLPVCGLQQKLSNRVLLQHRSPGLDRQGKHTQGLIIKVHIPRACVHSDVAGDLTPITLPYPSP